MNQLYASARSLSEFLDEEGLSFCIIGGLAVLRWGELRNTDDVDIAIWSGFEGDDHILSALLGRYRARGEDVEKKARRYRVLTLLSDEGTPIDASLAALDFEQRMIERSSQFQYAPGAVLRTCSAEDLVVMKVFAGRLQDWADVERILVRQGRLLNVEQVRSELVPLLELKESPELLAVFERMAKKVLDSE